MCGIIASLSKVPTKDHVEKIKKQYEEQRNRGTQGYGFVGVDAENKVIHARFVSEGEVLAELDRLPAMKSIIFHHRIPTCNMNVVPANHPLFIASKKNLYHKYFIVHNGHIGNSDALREIHEKEGFTYKSTIEWYYKGDKDKVYAEHTDTESLGIEMAKYIEQKSSHVKCKGGAAIFMLEIDRENNPINFYAFRQTNPIKWFRNQNGIFLASEAKGVELDEKKLFRINLETLKVSQREAELTSYSYIGQDYADKEYSIMPDGGFIDIEKKKIVEDISAFARPTEAARAIVTQPYSHTEHRVGNTLFLPKEKALEIGFYRLKKKYPLSSSLRTYSELEDQLMMVDDILADLDIELFNYEEEQSKGADLDTEYYYNLKQRHKTFVKIQEEICLEMEIAKH